MKKETCLPIVLLLVAMQSTALASPITYFVTVDTSSVSGTTGSLDFNFNPGPLSTQAASLQILNFAGNGTLAGDCPCGTGDVSGQLPGTLTFDNGVGFNDYFDDFTYGSSISFDASFYGPALSAPDGISTSGSALAFSLFSDQAGTVPVLTDDTTNGIALTVDVNLDGTTTLTDYSTQTEIEQASPIPEPSTMSLLALGISLLLIRLPGCTADGNGSGHLPYSLKTQWRRVASRLYRATTQSNMIVH